VKVKSEGCLKNSKKIRQNRRRAEYFEGGRLQFERRTSKTNRKHLEFFGEASNLSGGGGKLIGGPPIDTEDLNPEQMLTVGELPETSLDTP
jgi:hypothetical protein